jgi:HEAT repeat protein
MLAVPFLIALSAPLAAQAPEAPAGDPTAELVELERLRAEAASILEEYLAPAKDGVEFVERANDLVDRLAARSRDYAPFIVEELERDLRSTFEFCTLALGRMDAPEAEPALLRAISRADEASGEEARARKSMAVWGLGLRGEVVALDLMEDGRHAVARHRVHNNTSLLEAVAFQTAPECIPRLYELAETYLDDGERESWIMYVLGALRRIADPTTVPRLVEFAKHPNGLVRREAARALAAIPTSEALSALGEGLSDELLGVRRVVALSLEKAATPESTKAILARLEVDDDWMTRAYLYRALARGLGSKAWVHLEPHLNCEDPRERRGLVEALGSIDRPEAIAALGDALGDPDAAVGVNAAAALGSIGSHAAVDALVASLPDSDWLVLQTASKQLAKLHARSAGPALASRLFDEFLDEVIEKPQERSLAERLVDGLVEVRYTVAAPRLRKVAERQTDRALVNALERGALRLEAIESHGNDVAKWADAVKDPDREMRHLAYSRLAEIGSAPAASVLAAAFDDADDEDRAQVLRSLGDLGSPRAAALLERVLTSPEFDPSRWRRVREHAAWSARRIGGRQMYDLLREAVERRNGRDARITAYAALTGGKRALPLLASYRRTQMQYFGWKRGVQQEALDRLAREIAAGRSVAEFDQPPERSLLP